MPSAMARLKKRIAKQLLRLKQTGQHAFQHMSELFCDKPCYAYVVVRSHRQGRRK